MSGFGGMGGMSGMGGMGSPSMQQQDEMRMTQLMQEMQVTDSLRMYNELVHRCFGQCVESFRSRKLDGKEETCIRKCSEKYVKFAARAGQRFQERQAEMAAEAAKGANAAGGM